MLQLRPKNIKALFHPGDFFMLNGLKAGDGVEDFTFLTKARCVDELQKSVAKVVK